MNGLRTAVLDEDPELGALVADSRYEAARAASTAAVLAIPVGTWDGMTDAQIPRGGFGLLVFDGLLVRRVGFDGRWGAELLGHGDLLRPWESDGESSGTLPFETSLRVMTPLRVATLDLHWAARMGPYPQIAGELAGRALRRSRRLAAAMAIVQVPRLDERLWMIFWELADRWGRVHPDGVHLDVPLTHELLSHLAAARRPSVSGALTRLADCGRVKRVGRSWVLYGEPPDPGAGIDASHTIGSRT